MKKLKNEVFVGVSELAAAAAQILISTETFQNRETVTSLPDERTVRYYITEGLISPSDEKQGTSSVYGYLQLLQLLVVKKLQADNLSIRQIRKIVANRKTDELENLLETKEVAEEKNDAQKFLESLLVTQHLESASLDLARGSKAAVPSPSLYSLAQKQETVWRRFEVEPGLEIHVAEDFNAPPDAKTSGRLLQKIQHIVESLRKGKK